MQCDRSGLSLVLVGSAEDPAVDGRVFFARRHQGRSGAPPLSSMAKAAGYFRSGPTWKVLPASLHACCSISDTGGLR